MIAFPFSRYNPKQIINKITAPSDNKEPILLTAFQP
jgi:hypothetical protein